MPQLDFYSIANQFTWGIFYFVIFYLFVNNFIVPVIFASIFAREFVIRNANADNFETVYYSFAAFYIFNVTASEISTTADAIATGLVNVDFSTFVLVSKLTEFDILGVDFEPFEDFDLID